MYEWYAGRIAAIETFELTDEIRDEIVKWVTPLQIYQLARETGYLTMKEDAYIKMLKWLTTLEEIRRVL
jgi:type II secretory ATPase GspE/PulE/Tfp pilus assembly ATPase PilB-like protein